MAYAEASDLLTRYPDLKTEPSERIEAVLSDVSAAIDGLVDASTIDIDVLKLVCVRVASRMLQSEDTAGITSESWGASPFSQSVSYSNPSGDIYFTAFEKQLLGLDSTDCEVSFANPGANYDKSNS